MSGEVTFDATAAKDFVHNRVFNAVDVLAGRIQGNAKSNAPVRKTEKYQRAYKNRGTPAEVGFFKPTTLNRNRQIGTVEALGEIANSIGGGTTDEDVARAINVGDVKGNQRNMARIRKHMARQGIEARLLRKGNHPSSLVRDIARLHGVTLGFEEEAKGITVAGTSATGGLTGRAEVGGTLRRSIVSTGAKDEGQHVKAKVYANARYARWVEFGSAHTHGHAHPFMMPAFKAIGTKEQLAKAIKW